MRFAFTPPSPPKNAGSMSDIACTISPMPSEIIAKATPALRVVTQPMSAPKSAAASPPTSGSRVTGRASLPWPIRFSAWIAKYAPSPM